MKANPKQDQFDAATRDTFQFQKALGRFTGWEEATTDGLYVTAHVYDRGLKEGAVVDRRWVRVCHHIKNSPYQPGMLTASDWTVRCHKCFGNLTFSDTDSYLDTTDCDLCGVDTDLFYSATVTLAVPTPNGLTPIQMVGELCGTCRSALRG